MKNKNGITLIALVITIILLLILAGVAIYAIGGNRGIFDNTKEAVKINNEATAKEQVELLVMEQQFNYYNEVNANTMLNESKKEYILGKLESIGQTSDYYVEVLDDGEIEVYDKKSDSKKPIATGVMQESGTILWDKEIVDRKIGYEIEVGEIKDKSVTVTLKREPKEGESYTYIVETEGNKIEKPNLTTLTQVITGLKPETKYTVYVIVHTNKGKNKETNKIEITTPEAAVSVIGTPNTTNTYRGGNQLPFNWSQLGEIAGGIANDPQITNNTLEFTLKYNGKNYTIGVGDYTTVNGKRVRILGFKHDELVNKAAYGAGTNTTYAGISFEYVDFIAGDTRLISKNSVTGGWAKFSLRGTLNGTLYNGVKGSVNIKQVKKAYCAAYTSNTLSYAQDYLWLLSGEEVWGGKRKFWK